MKKLILIFILLINCLGVYSQGINVRSDNKVVVGGEHFYVHPVQKGETLFSLGRTYGVEKEDIVKYNPTVADGLKEGSVIKIPVSEKIIEDNQKNLVGRVNNRRVATHIVNKGETAYSIAKRYAVTIDDIITANPGFDPLNVSIGQQVLIPKSIIGSVTQTEIKDNFGQYTDALSDITSGFEIYLVEAGETLYSISKAKNIDIDTIKIYNREQLKDGLKFGTLLKLPSRSDKNESDVTDAAASVTNANGDYADNNNRVAITFPNYNQENRTGNIKPGYVSGPVNVALLLPFSSNSRESFYDFYNGMLLALAELKTEGISVNLNVFDTKRSEQEVVEIIRKGGLDNADLIIGPVYDNTFSIAAQFAYENNIPVVSPLGAVTSGNDAVYQIAPATDTKYDKLKALFPEEANVVAINSQTGVDSRFMDELRVLLPSGHSTLDFVKGRAASTYSNLLSLEKKNVIVIPTENETVTEEILTKLSSIQNSISSRSGRFYDITVVGSNRWARFNNIDRQLYFKLGLTFVTTYHTDRSDRNIRDFESKYIGEFGKFPTQYSFRGYDISKLFIPAVKNSSRNLSSYLGRTERKILQVPYRFIRDDSGKWINGEWVVVKYNTDFTIDVY